MAAIYVMRVTLLVILLMAANTLASKYKSFLKIFVGKVEIAPTIRSANWNILNLARTRQIKAIRSQYKLYIPLPALNILCMHP